jgi:uncharacterized protein DUF4154
MFRRMGLAHFAVTACISMSPATAHAEEAAQQSAFSATSPRLRARRWLALPLAILTLTSALIAAEPLDEYRVKAALIYNIAKFVDWPDEAFGDPTAPLTVCVLGRDPFGDGLDAAVKGQTVRGRGTLIRRVVDVAPGCHILFVAESDGKRLRAILDRVRDTRVLTVGESSTFLDQGGIIRLLVTEDARVRFEVNLAAAERAHVKISARVLALAVSVRRAETRP